MKRIKKSLVISTALLAQLGLYAQPQKPFSPCSTDAPCQVIIHNNLTEALGDYLGPAAVISDRDTINTYQNGDSECDGPNDDEISHIKIEVNKHTLNHGEDILIDISHEKALKITLSGPMRTMISYLIKNNLLSEIDNSVIHNLKQWTTGFITNTYGLFKKINAEQIYENNKNKILTAYARMYQAFNWFGTCEIEIVLDAQKLRSEFIENAHTPTVISFHRIIHEVIERMDEPDRFKYNGSMYNPVIQIV